jgi:hypothetical protein
MNTSLSSLQESVESISNSIHYLREEASRTDIWLFVLSAGTFIGFVLTIWLLAKRTTSLAKRVAALEGQLDKP